jgi:hypothetical protein
MADKPIIISSFFLSEPHETNMLLIKLNVEDPGVTKWVITENLYSFRGDYKGPIHFKNILNEDKRFEQFLPKIEFVEAGIQRKCKPGIEDLRILFLQRETQRSYIESFDTEAWVIVADVDEILDFDNPKKAQLIYEAMATHSDELIHPNPYFFPYDFDNLATRHGGWFNMIMARRGFINKKPVELEQLRCMHNVGYVMDYGSVGYHYHSCYPKDKIWRKLTTYGHTGFKQDELELSLYLNYGMFRSSLGESLRRSTDIMTVPLDEQNSPTFVRDNIDWLKTHSVHPDYVENRKKWLAERGEV